MVRLSLFVVIAMLLAACSEPPPAQRKGNGQHLVETVQVVLESVAIEQERTGTLRPVQEVRIFNQEEGRITELPYHEGDQVEQGEVLARLDDRLLRAQLARALALRDKAEKELKRISGLAKRSLASQTELTRVETDLAVAKADEQVLRTRLDYATLRAPFAGVISARLSEPGNIAERYTHLLTLTDTRTLITEVSVSELLINKLTLGQPVTLSIDALRDSQGAHALQGQISRIYPNVDAATRNGTLEIALQAVPGARPGQLARAVLRTQEAERLMIPFVALRRSSEGEYVYSVDAEGKAVLQPVQVGLRVGDRIEVLSGLQPGTQVVVRGFTNLRAGKAVTVVQPLIAVKPEPAS